jgi:alkyl sulfatase BDS1-like metallo-beta-lactamase superfamily hydrolase
MRTSRRHTASDELGAVPNEFFMCHRYNFLDAECPDTANPSLWRQSQLTAKDGLFEVVPGIYQVRGFDLSVGRSDAA